MTKEIAFTPDPDYGAAWDEGAQAFIKGLGPEHNPYLLNDGGFYNNKRRFGWNDGHWHCQHAQEVRCSICNTPVLPNKAKTEKGYTFIGYIPCPEHPDAEIIYTKPKDEPK